MNSGGIPAEERLMDLHQQVELGVVEPVRPESKEK